ncbi:M48 family metallopeptidase [Acuticoccus sp.]|uniref:M48 family metallopeptidase n=1 Tax=Acuticoccus sp. TaxID=1904378 RepID=UPI003B5167D9
MRRLVGAGAVVASGGVAQREEILARLPCGPTAIDVRRVSRARRMTLRVPPGGARPVVTIPLRAPLPAAERFVASQSGWLAARLAERSPTVAFADGAVVPLRGVPHVVRATGTVRGVVRVGAEQDGPTLWVPGAPEHLPRRLRTWLTSEARADLTAAVAHYAARVARTPTAVRVKDTRAQWGSCSPTGVLSFSWRLVLAPPFVLRYVAAHEVAHLVELNHSPAFWRLNALLDPQHARARAWLRTNGRALHAVGVTP